MRLLVYLPLLISLLAALAARPLAARLEAREATWLLTVATVALAGCSAVALALLAAAAAARMPVLATLGDYSQSVVHRADPTSAVTGAVAAVVLTGVAVAVAVALRYPRPGPGRVLPARRAAARRRHRRGRVRRGGRGVRTARLARPDRGLWPPARGAGRAGPGGAARARARPPAGRHRLFTTLAHLAAAANPVLMPLARTVDYTVERWADEHAARVTGDRRLVAVTIGRVAMLATPSRRRPPPPSAWCGGGGGGGAGARAPAGSRWPGPGRCPGGWPPCSARRHARGLLMAVAVLIVGLTGASALEAAGTCTPCLSLPASFTERGGARGRRTRRPGAPGLAAKGAGRRRSTATVSRRCRPPPDPPRPRRPRS